MLKRYKIQWEALQIALIAGEKSGPPAIFDSEAFLKRMRDKHGKESHADRKNKRF